MRVKLSRKVVVPLAVLAVAVAATSAMIAARPSARSTRPRPVDPLVEVIRVEPSSVQLFVSAQGSVEPLTESELVAEVSGRIVWVSPRLASGGFFDEDEVLVRIDPRDFEVALEGAEAALARAQSTWVHANAALERQRSMRQTGASSRARLDDAIHEKTSADAGVREARVAVRRAELDLQRSEIRAPFTGRVREKHVGVGQFVVRGASVARIYSTDVAEIRLPIDDSDLAYLNLPRGYHRPPPEPEPEAAEAPRKDAGFIADGPEVLLSARFGGEQHSWHGRVVRTEGALDPRTRMLNIVVQVDDPYARSSGSDHPPLPIGLFVEAEIQGRRFDGIFELPRAALHEPDQVRVVDAEGRLHGRRVDVLRSGRDEAWIRSGLEAGERVVVSPVELATDGMPVRTRESSTDARASSP